MKHFFELQRQDRNLAATLQTCSRDELLNLFALEVFEKRELEEYKENQKFYTTELECIVNWGENWLKDNFRDNNHSILITKDKSNVIYTNIEKTFI
ncbi:hypothetical protein EG352_07335 [Chryseobacterium indologenes]|uniref:Uncharacterized protein n=2 Tax=Chryseobacterium indologenes TaxID=253 RepID=A0AAD1DVU6_CHRID|nr:hypothetical protein EG352_07335 [Chryseobacterium indologenes]